MAENRRQGDSREATALFFFSLRDTSNIPRRDPHKVSSSCDGTLKTSRAADGVFPIRTGEVTPRGSVDRGEAYDWQEAVSCDKNLLHGVGGWTSDCLNHDGPQEEYSGKIDILNDGTLFEHGERQSRFVEMMDRSLSRANFAALASATDLNGCEPQRRSVGGSDDLQPILKNRKTRGSKEGS